MAILGQLRRQLEPSKNLNPEQERQPLLEALLHVSHSGWQESHVFVAEFSKTVVATHAVGHVEPSKNLPFGHDRQSLFVPPEHKRQFP